MNFRFYRLLYCLYLQFVKFQGKICVNVGKLRMVSCQKVETFQVNDNETEVSETT